jgi:hypothetical protein
MNEICDECQVVMPVLDSFFTGSCFICPDCREQVELTVIQVENRLRVHWRRFQNAMEQIEREASRADESFAM